MVIVVAFAAVDCAIYYKDPPIDRFLHDVDVVGPLVVEIIDFVKELTTGQVVGVTLFLSLKTNILMK